MFFELPGIAVTLPFNSNLLILVRVVLATVSEPAGPTKAFNGRAQFI